MNDLSGLTGQDVRDLGVRRLAGRKFHLLQGVANENPSDIGFFALIAEDFRTHGSDPLSQGFWALFWHRFGNQRMNIRSRFLRLPMSAVYKVGYKLSQWFCGIDLPYTTVVGRRVRLEHFGGMILVARSIGDDVVIRQNTTFGVRGVDDVFGNPVIGKRVEIGAGAVVVGAIEIGDDALIGANAVVSKSVPPMAIVLGNPGKVVRFRNEPKN